jgi:hypothetical protein
MLVLYYYYILNCQLRHLFLLNFIRFCDCSYSRNKQRFSLYEAAIKRLQAWVCTRTTSARDMVMKKPDPDEGCGHIAPGSAEFRDSHRFDDATGADGTRRTRIDYLLRDLSFGVNDRRRRSRTARGDFHPCLP